MKKRKDFTFSPVQEPHRERTKQILKAHPEVRHLIGKNPYSIFIILFIVVLQVTLAFWVKDRAWWVMLLVAYFVGAFANHAGFVMIHECAHNLLFRKRYLNSWAGILANLPEVIPSSVSFQRYHLKHHAFQGVYELDADIPSYWEAKLIGNHCLGKALWLLLFPFFQITRPARVKELKLIDKWVVINWGVQMVFNVVILSLGGAKALLYLLASLFFSIGLHPLGARWIQRHYLVNDDKQETYSYYGLLNIVAFNVGYHNEHHDFPSVPWNRLPTLKRTAPQWYDHLDYHKSWTKLLFRFLFSREISLFSRMIRSERGNVKVDDESTPDRDLIEGKRRATYQGLGVRERKKGRKEGKRVGSGE
jgi:sphingolipid delta-4 desaturase